MARFTGTKHNSALTQKELMRLARNFKILMGVKTWDKHSIMRVLEHVCAQYDKDFSFEISDFSMKERGVQAFYDRKTHTVCIDEAVYIKATKGEECALFTVVHELAHWALIWLFKAEPAGSALKQPFFCPISPVKRAAAEYHADMFACLVLMPDAVLHAKRRRTVRRYVNGGKNRLLKQMVYTYYNKRRNRCAESFRKAKKSLSSTANRKTGTTKNHIES